MLVHVMAVVTVGGVAAQVAVAALTEPKNLFYGSGITLLTLTALVTGWLITLRRPANPLGWLIIAVPLLLGLQGYAALFATVLSEHAPVAAAWFDWYGGDNEWSWLPPIGILFTQIPLRFPTGALPSARWRWYSRLAVAVVVMVSVVSMTLGDTVGQYVTDRGRVARLANPTFVDWEQPAGDLLSLASFALLVLAAVGALASMAVRYRHAGPVERAQLRWVFWAVSVVVGLLVTGSVLTASVGGTEQPTVGSAVARLFLVMTSVTYSLIPLAILFAVLRRGLYSIDRIISRTAAYAIVTLVVIGTYGLVVLLVSLVFPHEKGQQTPSIVIALATLAAAAVFLPALRRIRRGIDRVFNRSQYDAERVVVSFGERIRNGADPHTAGADLVGAVRQTLQPSALGLWTREDVR